MGNMFYHNMDGMMEQNFYPERSNEAPVHPSNDYYQEKTEFRRAFRTPDRGTESGPSGSYAIGGGSSR
jgi:hypothetical protein